MNDEVRQKMIVRQSCIKAAIELLNSEAERSKIEVRIPVDTIRTLTKELEDFVWELDDGKSNQDKAFNKTTGKVEDKQPEHELVI